MEEERKRVKQEREIREIDFYFIKLNRKYIAPTLFIDYRLSIPESKIALKKLRTNSKLYSVNSGVTAWLE